MTDEQARETLAKLIQDARIALVTTTTAEGHLVSRPMAMQERDFDGTLWFFTPDPSPKTEQVLANEQVNVALETGGGYVSVSGRGSVSRDQALIDELWNREAEAWFDGGRSDPTLALLRVEADSAEYWSIDSPKLLTMVKYAKSVVTGEKPDVGDNETLTL